MRSLEAAGRADGGSAAMRRVPGAEYTEAMATLAAEHERQQIEFSGRSLP